MKMRYYDHKLIKGGLDAKTAKAQVRTRTSDCFSICSGSNASMGQARGFSTHRGIGGDQVERLSRVRS